MSKKSLKEEIVSAKIILCMHYVVLTVSVVLAPPRLTVLTIPSEITHRPRPNTIYGPADAAFIDLASKAIAPPIAIRMPFTINKADTSRDLSPIETKNAAVERATAVPPNIIPLTIVSIGRNPPPFAPFDAASAPYIKSRTNAIMEKASASLRDMVVVQYTLNAKPI